MEAMRKVIPLSDLASLGLEQTDGQPEPLTRVLGVFPPRPRPKKVFASESDLTPQERRRLMMRGELGKKKSTDLLEGDPGYVAEQLLQFLRKHGFVA
jgi:hypothetical protein